MRFLRLFPALAPGIAFFLWSASAATQVCTEAELRTALSAGGTITFGCDQTLVLTSPLKISTSVELDADGRNVTLSGGGTTRIFDVSEGVTFSARNLRIINGYHKGAPATYTPPSGFPGDQGTSVPGGMGSGGALAATNATIHFASCVFSNNVAEGGDPIFPGMFGMPPPYVPGGAALGGAIHLMGAELTLTNSAFLTNSARAVMNPGQSGRSPVPWTDGNGGAISIASASLTVSGCDFHGNSAVNGGGAIHSRSANLTLENSSFNTNVVVARTADRFAGNPESNGHGGALESRGASSLLVTNCSFKGNFVTGAGGYFGSGGTLAGGAIYSEQSIEVKSSEFVENTVRGGGQIAPPVISRGGAICVDADADLTESRFAKNSVMGGIARQDSGGGRRTPASVFGGGLYVVGTLQMAGSSWISNNLTSGPMHLFLGDPVEWGRAQGSAIYASNSVFSTNVTIAFNECRDGNTDPAGVAVFLTGGGAIVLTNEFVFCTFATNRVGAEGKNSPLRFVHAAMDTNVVATFRGTILAGGSSNTVRGDIVDAGYNITSDDLFTEVTSKNATDAKLGTIGFYGGGTETIPILNGSPAIDAVTSGAIATDQRGRARPFRAADVGAYEISAPFVVHGRIQNKSQLGAVTLTASGAPVDLSEFTGEFGGFFPTTGVLKPTAAGIVFFPAEIPLAPEIEIFDASFTGYFLNQVAIENGPESKLTISFAAETAADYSLFVSDNLTSWTATGPVQSVSANGLFRTEISLATGPHFFRVGKQ